VSSSLLYPFNLTLTVEAPVHIGSGERLSAAEFQIEKRDGKDYLSVFSLDALLRWVARQPNPERLASLLTSSLENPKNGGMRGFIRSQKVPPREVESYALPLAEGVSPAEINEALTFIKTAADRVFVPGSSLKGAFRSALLRGALIQRDELRTKAENMVSQGLLRMENKTYSAAIEAEAFVKPQIKPARWSNYDLNRLLHIRDSSPFEAQDALRLYAVRILSVSTNGKMQWKLDARSNKETNLFVEMLPADFRVSLPVVWQAYLLSDKAAEMRQADREALFIFWNDFVRQASLNLLGQEIEFYERHSRPELKAWFQKRLSQLEKGDSNEVFLPLGWGSGYDAKTITDLFSEQTFEAVVNAFSDPNKRLRAFRNVQGLGRPGNQPGADWLGAADSPKSRKVIYRSETDALPVGWVAVRLEPVDEAAAEWMQAERARLARYQPAVKAQPRPAEPDKPASSAQPATPQTQPAPAAAPVKPVPPPQPQPQALIPQFDRTPRVGEVFEGTYLEEDSGEVLYEIPGLDLDTQAYAVVLRSQYPNFPKKMQRCRLTVKQVVEVGKNYFKVICEPDW